MTNKPPARSPAHCGDDGAWAEFSRQYAGQPRSRSDLSDFALANAVFMADRDDLQLIVYQTAAKERIRWLSLRLAHTIEALEGAVGALEFSRDYHKDLGNEDQAFAQDRLDAALAALEAAK